MTQVSASNRRWWVLVPLLVGAFWLAVFGDKTPVNTEVQAVVGQAKPRTLTVSASSVRSSQEGRLATGELQPLIPRSVLIPPDSDKAGAAQDLFANRNWTPPVRPIAVSAPPPPMAPPLPFVYLGKKLEAGVWEVYLARGEQNFVVRAGSVIETVYRVDAIALPNINFTYLPLGQSQSLAIGETR